MNKWMVVVAATIVLAGTSVEALAGPVSVSFSYRFASGETLSGVVEGDLLADGDTVTGLRHLRASYSGQPGTALTFLADEAFSPRLSLSGSNPITFYGFASNPDTTTPTPNFGFAIATIETANAVTVGTFLTTSSGFGYPAGPGRLEATPFDSAAYTAVATPAVPEPASILLGVTGLAGLCIAACRRGARAE